MCFKTSPSSRHVALAKWEGMGDLPQTKLDHTVKCICDTWLFGGCCGWCHLHGNLFFQDALDSGQLACQYRECPEQPILPPSACRVWVGVLNSGPGNVGRTGGKVCGASPSTCWVFAPLGGLSLLLLHTCACCAVLSSSSVPQRLVTPQQHFLWLACASKSQVVTWWNTCMSMSGPAKCGVIGAPNGEAEGQMKNV